MLEDLRMDNWHSGMHRQGNTEDEKTNAINDLYIIYSDENMGKGKFEVYIINLKLVLPHVLIRIISLISQ